MGTRSPFFNGRFRSTSIMWWPPGLSSTVLPGGSSSLGTARMRITLPSIHISWISALPAAGLSAPRRLARRSLVSSMYAPAVVWPSTVPRTHAARASTCPCAAAAAASSANPRSALVIVRIFKPSQHVAREILALRKLLELRIDESGVDPEALLAALARFERNLLQQLLHHRIQAPGADVLGLFIHRPGDLGETPDPVRYERDFDLLRGKQRLVLTGEASVGRREDSLEILHRKGIQLDTNGEAPLQLRNQVRRFGKMERSARDKEYMVGFHHSVLGGDGSALHEREQVPLHALARNVGADRLPAVRDFVDLVEKHDAVLLDVGKRLGTQVLVVHQASRLLVGEHPHRFADLHPAQFSPAAAEILKHPLDLLCQLLHPGRGEYLHVRLLRRHFDFDLPVVELALAQFLAKLLPRRGLFLADCVRRL